jgi:endonuclease/exonuclease/phosphatase family metal-dependent hydrolase
MVFAALSWNLLHGRDYPPDPLLRTTRQRLWPGEWRRGEFAQVNRPLRASFEEKLPSWEWDVALLQEAPPRWLRPLSSASGAHGVSALTSRNSFAFVRSLIASWNPDLIASNEGGSNQLLVRPPWSVAEVRRVVLARRPERRVALWARLGRPGGGELCVVCMHATAEGDHTRSARELLRVASLCVEWAPDVPLVLGGDMNLRPREHPWAFAELRDRFGLVGPTADDAVDHLLSRGLEVASPPRRLRPEEREVVWTGGARVRLSDHAPVEARFKVA